MNISPLQRRFVIICDTFPSYTIFRLHRHMGVYRRQRYYQCIYIQFACTVIPDIYGPCQRRSNIHAYMGNTV